MLTLADFWVNQIGNIYLREQSHAVRLLTTKYLVCYRPDSDHMAYFCHAYNVLAQLIGSYGTNGLTAADVLLSLFPIHQTIITNNLLRLSKQHLLR